MDDVHSKANGTPLPRDVSRFAALAKSPAVIVLLSLLGGLAFGAVLRPWQSTSTVSAVVNIGDIAGTMWVNAIRMTVIPLIIPLLIGAVAGARSGRSVGRLGLATGAWFFGLLTVAVLGATLLAPMVFGHLKIDPATTAALRATAAASPLPTGDASLSTWLKALVPTNPIKAAADGAMLSLVVFALAVGFAALTAPENVRERTLAFTSTLSELMLIVIKAVLKLAPFGVFALTLVVGVKLGGAAFSALGYYVIVDVTFLIVTMIALCIVAISVSHLSPRRFIAGATPAMLVAAGTSSSLSALPAMIEAALDDWTLPEDVVGFILPLAVSTFKLTSGTSWVVNAVFVAALYGVHLGPAELALIAGYTILMNATIPGIPGGGLIAQSPLFLALGLPLEGLAVLFAVNPITDRFLTVGNVVADLTVTAILGRPSA